MKSYPIWYKGCGEMALDRQTEGWTDEAVTICSLFGEHDKQITISKNKLDISKNCNFTRNPVPFFFHDRASNWKTHSKKKKKR